MLGGTRTPHGTRAHRGAGQRPYLSLREWRPAQHRTVSAATSTVYGETPAPVRSSNRHALVLVAMERWLRDERRPAERYRRLADGHARPGDRGSRPFQRSAARDVAPHGIPRCRWRERASLAARRRGACRCRSTVPRGVHCDGQRVQLGCPTRGSAAGERTPAGSSGTRRTAGPSSLVLLNGSDVLVRAWTQATVTRLGERRRRWRSVISHASARTSSRWRKKPCKPLVKEGDLLCRRCRPGSSGGRVSTVNLAHAAGDDDRPAESTQAPLRLTCMKTCRVSPQRWRIDARSQSASNGSRSRARCDESRRRDRERRSVSRRSAVASLMFSLLHLEVTATSCGEVLKDSADNTAVVAVGLRPNARSTGEGNG